MSPAKKQPVNSEAPAATPFNRKYRPQSFDTAELVGQEHIVRTLKNAIRSNRIASAYLFCGPRGTGKTSTARILAKAVNCLDPDPDNRPCNRCTACQAINAGATPDIIEIDAASNRGIDDIRDLRERVNYAPTQLKTKFYIIDEAHQITGAAANAFLKTLEEPPAHSKFILATTNPEELLPTIVSRCQRFDFRSHTPEGIVKRIRALAEREGIKLSDDALTLVAELAHGSMRDPIGLLDQLANYRPTDGAGGVELRADDIRELVGITHSEVAERVIVAMSDGDATSALLAINEAANAGQDPRQLNRQILSLIRDGLYIASGARAAAESPSLRAANDRLGLTGWLRLANAFADTDSDIRAAVIPQLPLEMAVLAAIIDPAQTVSTEVAAQIDVWPNPSTRPSEAVKSPVGRSTEPASPPEQPESQHRTQEAAPVSPSPGLKNRVRDGARAGHAASHSSEIETRSTDERASVLDNAQSLVSPAPDSELTIELLIDLWPVIRADIKSLDRRTEALLMEIDPVQVADGEVILAASYDFHRTKVNEVERRSIVESVIGRRVGRSVRVQCVLRSDLASTSRTPSIPAEAAVPSSEPPAKVPEGSQAGADADLEEKLLGAVVRIFDGEVLDD